MSLVSRASSRSRTSSAIATLEHPLAGLGGVEPADDPLEEHPAA